MKNVSNSKSLLFILLLAVSCKYNESEIMLSGGYRLTTYKSIESDKEEYLYKNKIYPVVTAYSFNSSYILAEQIIDSIKIIERLSSNLYQRFKKYNTFLKNPELFKDTFYIPFDGLVQRDSTLYRLFVSRGASNGDTPGNIGISIDIAKNIVENDKYYRKIFSSPNKRCYWIIKIKSDTLIGPLTKGEYIQYKSAMRIPKNTWLPPD